MTTTTTPPSLDALHAHAGALPSLPEVVTYLVSALRDDSADLETLTRYMNSDPAIVARLLAAANSVSAGLSRRVYSTAQAFMLLGANRVIDTVLASALIHRYDTTRATDFSASLFWRHSVGVAVCARVLAEQIGADTETSFISGLLHDIGRLLMHIACPDGVHQALERRQRDDSPLVVAEREVFGYDHCEAGRVLATAWCLPREIVDAIAAHHEPDEFGDELCSLTHVAECLCHALDLGDIQNNRVPELSDAACARLGISWPMFAACFGEIDARFDNFRIALGL